MESYAWVKTILGAVSRSASGSRPPIMMALTNASKPWGACMTELGCSSSSDPGFNASSAVFGVSSYKP